MRTILTALALLVSCDRSPGERPKQRPPALDASAEPSPGAKVVASIVASVRSRELRIAAPAWELQSMAFGRELFVRLTNDRVEAYAMPAGSLLFELPFEEPRAAVEIPGGSIVALGSKLTLRIDPRGKEPVRLAEIPFLPGTVLVPDRRTSAALWTVHTVGRTWAHHALVFSGKPALENVLSLDDYDGGPVTAMRDGALLYRAERGVRRVTPGGRPRALDVGSRPWRLLPGRRVDTVWAVTDEGGVELWHVADGVRVIRRLSLGFPPFAVAASSEHLAAVTVEEGSGKPRRFRLVVVTEEGERVLGEELPEAPLPEGERWAAVAGRDRQIALSEDGFVAVGGPGSVRVVSLADRRTVLSR